MDTQGMVEVVGEVVRDEGVSLERQHGSSALVVAREMESALRPVMEGMPAYAPLWQLFCDAPQEQAPALAGVLQVLLSADAALARRLDALLARYRAAVRSADAPTVHTDGGAYIGGSVTAGGDFVGRDSVVINGDGNVVGDGSRATVIKRRGDPQAVARAFAQIYEAVAARPVTAAVDKAELKAELQDVEQEIVKGDAADEGFVIRRLLNVGRMAPDILEVVLKTFANPLAGLGMVAKKVADKARAED